VPLLLFIKAGKQLLWNNAVLETMEYSEKENGNITPLDFFEDDDIARVQSVIEETLQSGNGVVTANLRRKDHTMITIRFTATRIICMAETCLYGVGIDLSEDNCKLIAIEESELRFKVLVQEASELISVMDDF
jgi:PAS domain S-box-containing protein